MGKIQWPIREPFEPRIQAIRRHLVGREFKNNKKSDEDWFTFIITLASSFNVIDKIPLTPQKNF